MTIRPLLLLAVTLALLLPPAIPVEAQDRLAITSVTVVDVAEGALRPHQTMIVSGDRIVAVGDADVVELPAGAVVIDGSGKYLIPGLWDMHVHLFNQLSQRPPNLWYLPLFVANGVTGVREMWAKPRNAETVRMWREQIETGRLLGPRIGPAGALVDGRGSWWATADVAPTDAEARRFVREAKAADLDFVKVYSMLRPEAYFAIVDEAARVGLPVAGHIPLLVRAGEAAEAGQRSNEHLHQIREACSNDEARVLAERRRLYSGAFSTAEDDSLWERHQAMGTESYDSRRCAALAERLAASNMWQVPTLVNERGHFLGPAEGAERDPRLVYLPPDERRFWREGLREYTEVEMNSQARGAERLRRWEATQEVVRVLARADVPFMTGTDLGNPGLYPGFSVHKELEMLVEAGLTSLQALQAATLNPARYLEATDSLGTVEVGKVADLVLLDANPLEDISNTQQIRAVVLDGRYFDRSMLDELLTDAARAASSAGGDEGSGGAQ